MTEWVKGRSGLNNLFGSDVFEESLTDIDVLFDKVKSSPANPQTEKKFNSLIKAIKIFSYDEDGVILTQDDLLSHLFGDVTASNGKKYFYVEKDWYQIKPDFLTELDEVCGNFVNAYYHDGVVKPWDHPAESEGEYNQKYIGDPNTIVLDRVTPENVELCDILTWDNDNLYLHHVKAEFGNQMRDLCSQISIAANWVARDINNQKDYAKKIYAALVQKKGAPSEYFKLVGKQTDKISETQFIKLFDKNIVLVLSVLDTAITQRSIKEIEKFNSSIAKFSIQVLAREIKSLDKNIVLKIVQIPKGSAQADKKAA